MTKHTVLFVTTQMEKIQASMIGYYRVALYLVNRRISNLSTVCGVDLMFLLLLKILFTYTYKHKQFAVREKYTNH